MQVFTFNSPIPPEISDSFILERLNKNKLHRSFATAILTGGPNYCRILSWQDSLAENLKTRPICAGGLNLSWEPQEDGTNRHMLA